MSLFVVAILMIIPFVALALMIAVGAFLVVQIAYEIVDRRATTAAVRLHTESRTTEAEPAREASPAPTTQTETARVA
jgi:hypothetical protein